MIAADNTFHLCCDEHSGPVRFVGFTLGVGGHGGQLVLVELLDYENLPVVVVDSQRLVEREACLAGWSRA